MTVIDVVDGILFGTLALGLIACLGLRVFIWCTFEWRRKRREEDDQ